MDDRHHLRRDFCIALLIVTGVSAGGASSGKNQASVQLDGYHQPGMDHCSGTRVFTKNTASM